MSDHVEPPFISIYTTEAAVQRYSSRALLLHCKCFRGQFQKVFGMGQEVANRILRYWDCLFLNWIGALTLSLLLILPTRKFETGCV